MLAEAAQGLDKLAAAVLGDSKCVWIHIMKACSPSEEVMALLDKLQATFDTAVKTATGLTMRFIQKRINFDMVLADRVHDTNTLAIRIVLFYANLTSQNGVYAFGHEAADCIWAMCVSRLKSADAIQRILASRALLRSLDIGSMDSSTTPPPESIFFLSCMESRLEPMFACLNQLLESSPECIEALKQTRANMEVWRQHITVAERALSVELKRVTSKGELGCRI
jgi:hypothetical protein